ncbi:MAG: glycosyltransferase [bacterium]
MISLITSLYKSERYLPKYLKSIERFAVFLKNKNIDFEFLIIANDPSQKEKKLISESLKINSFIRYFEVKREPLYCTWNRGVRLSKGDVLSFWNVDDIRHPDAVVDSLDSVSQGAQVVYFTVQIKWYLSMLNFSIPVKYKRVVPPLYSRKEFVKSMHCGPFFVFTKEIYQKVGPFDEQFKIVGDFDWCTRAARITDKFVRLDKSAGLFCVDGTGLSSGGKPIHVAENNIVYIRQNAKEKIEEVDQELVSRYDPERILYQGNWYDFNSLPDLKKVD